MTPKKRPVFRTGKRVLDVALQDIKRGKRGNAYACPIVRALRRRYKALEFVEVAGDYVAVSVGAWLFTASLPRIAKTFVRNFDRGAPVAPFRSTITFTRSQ